MRVKICGITKLEQGQAIAQMGATALGFICVPTSPRYITAEKIRNIVVQLPKNIDKIGVFVNPEIDFLSEIIIQTQLTSIQLHGDESPEFCHQLRQSIPDNIEIIKAFRIKSLQDLTIVNSYDNYVDTLLLDAYHPDKLGGTGQTLDWKILKDFYPNFPWFLAGGLTPENVTVPIQQLIIESNHKFCGIDLSSGVEIAPGDKDLVKVKKLFNSLAQLRVKV
ncbi:MAG: phosphoribosylanthranilate isomerase [Okeania sp. SIO2G4]|uniref:phosphoribosylanthranilate isomerase n=1 Tax=unclassified Okeania TaxID=2634635 RepID=UPI0013BCCD09|nr:MULTISPECIES: phosphoribosylanthranilate isomerase [unclassified Okeania]NEP07413.1 phosphoribosylanthranilate isomerase [Okeania sp. SIO4D6]NEP73756.1 phosphoribosylanthranilate isomerase [Okeania sp. SIO2G5]NEP94414.1 phosphoribosylanthranilate isomerase [Okeania sp. SIO2F5]NEQ92282.1 phosphoribosylanthranilate isomerase [Okeania sp. SIO2G4]